MMAGKKIKGWLILLLTLCVVTACGDKAEDDEGEKTWYVVPNAYFVGNETINALQSEAGVELGQLTTTENGAFLYSYAGFEDVNTSVQTYAELLSNEENGFCIVDSETLRSTSAPDYTTEDGSVVLARETDGEKLAVVRLNWRAGACEAAVSIEEKPVIEEVEEAAQPQRNYGLSHVGAIEYLKTLNPASLQLEGESMDTYNVYIMNGFTYVDGEACLRVEIYSDDNTAHTNTCMGRYFMSGNGEHIYLLGEDGAIEEMAQQEAQ